MHLAYSFIRLLIRSWGYSRIRMAAVNPRRRVKNPWLGFSATVVQTHALLKRTTQSSDSEYMQRKSVASFN